MIRGYILETASHKLGDQTSNFPIFRVWRICVMDDFIFNDELLRIGLTSIFGDSEIFTTHNKAADALRSNSYVQSIVYLKDWIDFVIFEKDRQVVEKSTIIEEEIFQTVEETFKFNVSITSKNYRISIKDRLFSWENGSTLNEIISNGAKWRPVSEVSTFDDALDAIIDYMETNHE